MNAMVREGMLLAYILLGCRRRVPSPTSGKVREDSQAGSERWICSPEEEKAEGEKGAFFLRQIDSNLCKEKTNSLA